MEQILYVAAGEFLAHRIVCVYRDGANEVLRTDTAAWTMLR